MRGTTSKAAFELFREGVRARAMPLTQALWKTSDRYFRQAIEKDTGLTFAEARAKRTGYPRAWSWMAYGVAQSYFEGWQGEQAKDDAVEFADLSVALDKFDYDNHWVAAYVHLLNGDTKKVEYHMDEALYLNEEDLNMSLLNEMADVLVWLGRPDEAITLLERGRRTTDWNRWSMAWSYYFKAQDDSKDRASAQKCYERALDEANSTFWKPGQEQYEHDIQLLVAAISIQQAALFDANNQSGEADKARKRSQTAKALFDGERPGWTIADERRRMPFAKSDAGQSRWNHWQDALRMLGLPESGATAR